MKPTLPLSALVKLPWLVSVLLRLKPLGMSMCMPFEPRSSAGVLCKRSSKKGSRSASSHFEVDLRLAEHLAKGTLFLTIS